MNQVFRQPAKEYLISAEDVARIEEIVDLQVPTGPGGKIKSVLAFKIKPYQPPTPPSNKPIDKK